jgi:hypothetical protein
VVAASGLTPVVAPYTIRRLLLRSAVVPPEAVTAEQLKEVLPGLLAELRVYLGHDEHAAAQRALEALVA